MLSDLHKRYRPLRTHLPVRYLSRSQSGNIVSGGLSTSRLQGRDQFHQEICALSYGKSFRDGFGTWIVDGYPHLHPSKFQVTEDPTMRQDLLIALDTAKDPRKMLAESIA